MKTLEDARKVTPTELRAMTEPQVDEYFAVAGDEYYRLNVNLRRAQEAARKAVGDRKLSYGWKLSLSEAKALIAAAQHPDGVRARERIKDIEDQIRDLDTTVEGKLRDEYNRRGGWTRAFLVTDGHVHSHQNCSSCHKGEYRTQFSWMIDYSGKTEEEIVEAADERACTICYPSAPVAKKAGKPDLSKSKMFTREEKDRAAAREEAAKRKAEKAAKAAAGAISLPDGTPLRGEVNRDGKQTGSVVKTLSTAKKELKQKCWYQYAWGDEDGRYERNIQHLARAVAWKENGLPVGEEPTTEQIAAVIKPLRDKAVKEVDKARASGR